jgi:HlyD family secretion protein
VESARAQITVAEAAVSAAASAHGKTTIRAPIDGIVLSRHVELGQTLVASLQTPVVFVIAEDLGHMELHVDVDEADVGRVREGQVSTFTVDAFPERTFEARVRTVHNAPRTLQNVVTYLAVLDVENRDQLLRPGMTATTRIVSTRREDVVLVPNSALRYVPPLGEEDAAGRREDRVYVLRSGTPERVSVRVGASDGTHTELLSDELRVGDRLVVDAREAEPKRPWEL